MGALHLWDDEVLLVSTLVFAAVITLLLRLVVLPVVGFRLGGISSALGSIAIAFIVLNSLCVGLAAMSFLLAAALSFASVSSVRRLTALQFAVILLVARLCADNLDVPHQFACSHFLSDSDVESCAANTGGRDISSSIEFSKHHRGDNLTLQANSVVRFSTEVVVVEDVVNGNVTQASLRTVLCPSDVILPYDDVQISGSKTHDRTSVSASRLLVFGSTISVRGAQVDLVPRSDVDRGCPTIAEFPLRIVGDDVEFARVTVRIPSKTAKPMVLAADGTVFDDVAFVDENGSELGRVEGRQQLSCRTSLLPDLIHCFRLGGLASDFPSPVPTHADAPLFVKIKWYLPSTPTKIVHTGSKALREVIIPGAVVFGTTVGSIGQRVYRYAKVGILEAGCGAAVAFEDVQWQARLCIPLNTSGAQIDSTSGEQLRLPLIHDVSHAITSFIVNAVWHLLIHFGASWVYRSLAACVEYEMAMTRWLIEGALSVGCTIAPLVHGFVVNSAMAYGTKALWPIIVLLNLLWQSYVWYIQNFIQLQLFFAVTTWQAVGVGWEWLLVMAEVAWRVGQWGMNWYFTTTLESQLMVAGVQTTVVGIAWWRDHTQRRVAAASRSRFSALLSWGPSSLVAALATDSQSILQYLLNHLIMLVLIFGVQFLPLQMLRTFIQHLVVPFQSHIAMLAFLRHPTELSASLVCSLVVRGAFTVVLQIAVADIVRGLIYEAIKMIVGTISVVVALWALSRWQSRQVRFSPTTPPAPLPSPPVATDES